MFSFRTVIKSFVLVALLFLIFITHKHIYTHVTIHNVFTAKTECVVRKTLFGGLRVNRSPQTRVLLWTQMRSGSSLVQKLLTVLSDTFRTEEPLREPLEELKQRRTNFSVQLLSDVMQCRFPQQLKYFSKWMFGGQLNDDKVKHLCKNGNWPCSDPTLTEAMCRAARLNLVRVVVAGLDYSIPLLEESVGARVIHLVRDPRALLTSRAELEANKIVARPQNKTFFTLEEKSPATVCARYRRDLTAAMTIRQHYPNRYM